MSQSVDWGNDTSKPALDRAKFLLAVLASTHSFSHPSPQFLAPHFALRAFSHSLPSCILRILEVHNFGFPLVLACPLFSSPRFSSLLFPSLSLHPEKLWTTKHVDLFQIYPGVLLAKQVTGCHAKSVKHVGFPFGQSAHVDRRGFSGTWWFEDTTPMSKADAVLERCCVVCFVSVWGGGKGGGGPFFFRLSHFLVFWAFLLALLNCRRFLAGQFFLSGDVCCWVFVSRVPCASMGLRSKLVCSIDEKVA